LGYGGFAQQGYGPLAPHSSGASAPRHWTTITAAMASSSRHAIEHDAELYSNDTDFGRFADLRWVNPLG
jgi:hypothetical protein